MKYIFSVLIFLHGTIHLMGFVKGFNLASIEGLSGNITRTAAIFWLLAFILFVVSGTGYLAGKLFWPVTAIAALVISAILITGMWSETKYGMIPNLIILAVTITFLSSCSISKMVSREKDNILSGLTFSDDVLITETDIAGLPVPVYNWLKSTGIVGKPKIYCARINQTALMKMKPGQKDWYKAEALQYTTTENPAFIWTVKMNMAPVIKIKGRDKFVDGKGEMLIRMNSLVNIVNEKGEKLDEGTLQRYLGELVWLPSLATSPYITWEQIDDFTAKATMTYKETEGSGVFHFNEHGDFVKFTALRFKGNENDARRHNWVLTVDDYSFFEGIKVPSKMKATWELDEGDWTWLKLEVINIRYNDIDDLTEL
ncbi:MAG: DUF6544 family protein [Bacteroidales bacterium]